MATIPINENKELVREYHKVVENQQIDRIPEFFSDDFTVELGQVDGSDSEEGGVDDLVERLQRGFEGFPDMTIEEKEMAAEGEWVLCRYEMTGTHEGDFMGIEPTGNDVWLQMHESYRIEDGEFVETHSTGSLASLLGQLDVDLPIEA